MGNLGSNAFTAIKISKDFVVLFDFTLIAILIMSFVGGLRGGIFSIVMNIIAIVIGFFSAEFFYKPVKVAAIHLLNLQSISSKATAFNVDHLAGLVSFLLVFSVTYALAHGIIYLFTSSSRVLRYSFVNRITGGIVNLLISAFVIVMFVVLAKSYMPAISSQIIAQSSVIHFLSPLEAPAKMLIARLSIFFREFYLSV